MINENFVKFLDELKGMDLEGKSLYMAYWLAKNAIKVLETFAGELNQIILEEMGKMELEKQEFDFGTFTKASRIKWEYSPKVFQAEKDIKELKTKEQEDGVAIKTETTYLLIK